MSPTWIWHVKLIPWSLSTSINFDEHRWLGHLHRPQTSPTLPPHITFQSQIATENRWYPPPCIISIPQPPKSHKRDNEAVAAQYSHQSTGPSSQDHLQNDAPDGPNKGGIIVQYEEIWTSCFPLQQMGLGREKRILDDLSTRHPLAPSPSSFDGRLTTQSADRLGRVDYHRHQHRIWVSHRPRALTTPVYRMLPEPPKGAWAASISSKLDLSRTLVPAPMFFCHHRLRIAAIRKVAPKSSLGRARPSPPSIVSTVLCVKSPPIHIGHLQQDTPILTLLTSQVISFCVL